MKQAVFDRKNMIAIITVVLVVVCALAIGTGYLDAMEVLAAKAVCICNKLKREYSELIT